MAHHEQGPEDRALGEPVEGPEEGAVHGVGNGSQARHQAEVERKVGEGAQGVALEALLGDGIADVLQGVCRGHGVCMSPRGRQKAWGKVREAPTRAVLAPPGMGLVVLASRPGLIPQSAARTVAGASQVNAHTWRVKGGGFASLRPPCREGFRGRVLLVT